MITRFGRAIDDLLGRRQYAIGKYHLKRCRYVDALYSFEGAERWYSEKYGPQHAYVVAALLRQGQCNSKLDRIEAACRAYRRALAIIEDTEGLDHPMAREVIEYLNRNCPEQ